MIPIPLETVWVIDCPFDPPHEHVLPGDWCFGGVDNLDWRADPRWKPSTYMYFDDKLVEIYVTQVPKCDDEAIDMFSFVASIGKDFNPIWLRVKRPDGTESRLPVVYDRQTDEVFDQ